MINFKSYFGKARQRMMCSLLLVLGGLTQAQAQDSSLLVCPAGQIYMSTLEACQIVSDATYLSASPDSGSTPSGADTITIANVLANDTVFWSMDDTFEPDRVEPASINYFQLAVVTPASHPGVTLNTSTGAVKAAASVPPGTYSMEYQVCFPGGFRMNNSTGEMTAETLSEKCAPPTAISITVTDQVVNTCDISLGYTPVVTVPVGPATPVPSLGIFAVAALAALIAVLAWRSRHDGYKARMLAIAGMAAAVSLLSLGGGSWIESVRAAGPYELVNPAGGTLADSSVPYADPAPLLTVTNTSGVRMRITANGNSAETGSCVVNSEIAPGASCTTQAYSCTPPAPLLPISVTAAPTNTCTTDIIASYPYNSSEPLDELLYAYAPRLVKELTFNETGVTTVISYVRNATEATYDGSNILSNREALTSGFTIVTSTAPDGYVFVPGNTKTMTWTLPYACWNEPA